MGGRGGVPQFTQQQRVFHHTLNRFDHQGAHVQQVWFASTTEIVDTGFTFVYQLCFSFGDLKKELHLKQFFTFELYKISKWKQELFKKKKKKIKKEARLKDPH